MLQKEKKMKMKKKDFRKQFKFICKKKLEIWMGINQICLGLFKSFKNFKKNQD